MPIFNITNRKTGESYTFKFELACIGEPTIENEANELAVLAVLLGGKIENGGYNSPVRIRKIANDWERTVSSKKKGG